MTNKSKAKKPTRGRKLNERQKNQVKRLISFRQEKYHFARRDVGVDASQSNTIVDCLAIAQGDGDVQRSGDSINIESIRLSYAFRMITTPDETNTCRLIMFQWKENSTPTAAKILEIANSQGSPHSDYFKDGRSLFNVLYDKTVFLSSNGPQIAGRGVKFIKKDKFAKKVDYTGGTSAAIKNKIYLLILSDSAVVNHPVIDYDVHTMYTDS